MPNQKYYDRQQEVNIGAIVDRELYSLLKYHLSKRQITFVRWLIIAMEETIARCEQEELSSEVES